MPSRAPEAHIAGINDLTRLYLIKGLAKALFCAGMVFILVLAAGCQGDQDKELGKPVDISRAIALAVLPPADSSPRDTIVVRGRVGHVCQTAGCWFILEDEGEDARNKLYVDLKPRADFTVPGSMSGRTIIVEGWLNARQGAEPQLFATGLVIMD